MEVVSFTPNASPASFMLVQMLIRTRQEGSSAKSLNIGTITEGIFYFQIKEPETHYERAPLSHTFWPTVLAKVNKSSTQKILTNSWLSLTIEVKRAEYSLSEYKLSLM